MNIQIQSFRIAELVQATKTMDHVVPERARVTHPTLVASAQPYRGIRLVLGFNGENGELCSLTLNVMYVQTKPPGPAQEVARCDCDKQDASSVIWLTTWQGQPLPQLAHMFAHELGHALVHAFGHPTTHEEIAAFGAAILDVCSNSDISSVISHR